MALSARMLLLTVCAVALALPGVFGTAQDCQFKLDTKIYDLSPLKPANGSYIFSEVTNSVEGSYLFFDSDGLSTANYTFQMQICGNIAEPAAPACKTPSPIYMISSDKTSCLALGNIEAAMFSENPYKDGINLRMYHGDALSHIQNYAATIYFVCNPKVHMSAPIFEHMTPFYAAHFKIFTSLVC